MKRTILILAALAVLLYGTWPAEAVPITYVEQATGSGQLGPAQFTNSLVTLTFVGNTTNVVDLGGGIFTNTVGTMTVNVVGIGTATFTDTVQPAVKQGLAAGVFDLTKSCVILGTLGSFTGYTLETAIGPISGNAIFNANFIFPTTLGDFYFSSLLEHSPATSDFTATAVPEPGTILLIGSGLLGLAGLRRKLKK